MRVTLELGQVRETTCSEMRSLAAFHPSSNFRVHDDFPYNFEQ